MSLIEKLRDDHARIRDALEKITQLRISMPEGRELLFQTKSLLINHLTLEDTELYPRMTTVSDQTGMAKAFQAEMAEISRKVLDFFAKYERGITDELAFARDFGTIRAMLTQRMIREESRLYPAFAAREAK